MASSGSAERAQAFVPGDAVGVTSSGPRTSRQVNVAAEGGLSLKAELAQCVADMEQFCQQERDKLKKVTQNLG